MLIFLVAALAYAKNQRAAIQKWTPLARVLLWGTPGLYTGWSSVAVWLNLTTALVGSGAPITVFIRGLLPYVATVAWAMGGQLRRPDLSAGSDAAFDRGESKR